MQRCLSLRDLNLRRSERQAFGALLEPPREEGLAAPVLSTDRLENPSPRARTLQLLIDCLLKPVHAHRERVQTSLRHGPTAKCVNDLPTSLRANHGWVLPGSAQTGLPATACSEQLSRRHHQRKARSSHPH